MCLTWRLPSDAWSWPEVSVALFSSFGMSGELEKVRRAVRLYGNRFGKHVPTESMGGTPVSLQKG
jgi:hypothetical protein